MRKWWHEIALNFSESPFPSAIFCKDLHVSPHDFSNFEGHLSGGQLCVSHFSQGSKWERSEVGGGGAVLKVGGVNGRAQSIWEVTALEKMSGNRDYGRHVEEMQHKVTSATASVSLKYSSAAIKAATSCKKILQINISWAVTEVLTPRKLNEKQRCKKKKKTTFGGMFKQVARKW